MPWNREKLDSEWPYNFLATEFELVREKTALLAIDMQCGSTHMADDSRMAQQYPAIAAYWNERVEHTVVPNVRRLIDFFRQHSLRVVHTRNGSVTPHGAETTRRLKLRSGGDKGDWYRGSATYEIDKRLKPTIDELVVDKLTSGAFTASMLDHALRNMRISAVVITGILTDMCVLGTARAAAELGYDTLICDDACATLTERAHNEALLMHARVFGRVGTTEDVIEELAKR